MSDRFKLEVYAGRSYRVGEEAVEFAYAIPTIVFK
eukprot:CAMPEP_0201674990 /NCGR_PEP_ID=MMETSP0494-20130426/38454_1 /ASSEMBLY_ACC=CAM_ASM_000839 /TAXON_ID=420259 /ORGANISM="Thalassiosira gravida, Strain GMp14c1" /LENGTH=34 /DNA_ID= /DNA_START= /DNA_END= /DNA_ORIENTATION=